MKINIPDRMIGLQLALAFPTGTGPEAGTIDWRAEVTHAVEGIQLLGRGLLVVLTGPEPGTIFISEDCLEGLVNGRGAPFVTRQSHVAPNELPEDAELRFFDDRR